VQAKPYKIAKAGKVYQIAVHDNRTCEKSQLIPRPDLSVRPGHNVRGHRRAEARGAPDRAGMRSAGLFRDWHASCDTPRESLTHHCPRTIPMKFETAILKTFFVVAVLTCALTFGAMVTAPVPSAANLVATAR